MKAKKISVTYGGPPVKHWGYKPKPPVKPPETDHHKTIRLLTRILAAVGQTNELLTKGSGHPLATKKDLKTLGDKIMAEIAVVTQNLKDAVISIKQVNLDIAETQTTITALTEKVAELQKAIEAGGAGVPQEVADLAAEVKDLTAKADAALPNPVVVPPVDEPPAPEVRHRR